MTSSSHSDLHDSGPRPLRVLIVGPCASGKSTLAEGLRARGYDASSVAQEHSSIRRMHARFAPDVLVYLEVSYAQIRARRAISWGPGRLELQHRRLAPARSEADIVVDTDGKRPEEVLEEVLAHIDGGKRT